MVDLYFLKKYNCFKYIAILSIILIFTSCAHIPKEREWQDVSVVRQKRIELQIGDILIKNKIFSDPVTWYGHSAIVVKENIIGEYPSIGSQYREVDAFYWLYEERNVMVLRYKKFDEKFKKIFKKNIEKYANKNYVFNSFFSGKENADSFYCSKYVWFLYFITAQELGYELDIDTDGGFWVFPYDMIGAKELDQIMF